MHQMQLSGLIKVATTVVVTTTAATCGNANGTLTIGAVTGGTAPYTYSVDGSAFTGTLIYNNLAAGNHTVSVKDANGCCLNAPAATINSTGGATAVVVTTTAATCGNANGTLTIGAVTGGTAPYTYSVDGGAFTATLVYNNLAAGNHTITVTDANGCIFTAAPATINTTGGATAVVVTTTAATCGNANGTLTIGAVTGGTAPYTYSVDGSAFTGTLVYNNLAAGNHTVSVTDANGCVFNAPNAIVGVNAGATAVVVTTTAATCGNANGTLTIGAVTGGTAPYTYSVDGSAFTGTLVYSNLAAGNHTVSIKDANGCVFNAPPATINNTGGATAVVVTTTAATCGNANGTLTIGAVTGGTAPYTYSVDGSAFTGTLVYNNLAAGNHTVSVKDANGCIFNATPGTINNTSGATAVVVTTTAATCGNANGTLTIGAVTGGTAPYTYSVDGSAFTGTLVYNNLAAGNHTVAVKDANGCVFNAPPATINNTGGATAVVVTTTAATCGNANGTLTIGAVTGGTAPYTYSVDGSAFTGTLVYNNLAAGNHTVAVKDANGCIFNATPGTINNTSGATAVVVTTTAATCGNANGTLTIGAVTGGTAPYTYSVDGSAFTGTLVYNNLAAGNHTVSVKDANGCVFNATPGTINNTGGATAVVVTTTAATCGNANGTLTIGAVTGGTAPYTYSVDGSAFTGTLVYNNLAAGNHTVSVTDANGCVFNAPPATINNTGGATAVVVTTTAATCGNANGTLTIGAVTGGTAPYTYSVDGSAFTGTLVYNNLAAGNHTISVKDANGCIFNAPPATINSTGGATAVVVTTTDATCGNANGTLTIGAVTGGTAPYTYSVDGSAFTGTLVYNNLASGNHTVSVKDANGCVFNAPPAVVGASTGAAAVVVTTTAATCGNANGTLTIGAVTGGTAPYTYSVDGSAFTGTLVYNNLAAGNHTVSVKDANGCVFTAAPATINNTGGATAVVVTTTAATCGNANGTLTIGAVTGGTAPYTYSVDGSAFTGTLVYNNLAAGNHTVAVKDANGCIFNAPNAIVGASTGATTVVVTTTAATCGNANGTLTIGAVTGGTAPYTYSVDGSAFTATLVYNNLAAGNHTVSVKDANGCVFNAPAATINSTGGATAVVVTTTAATCGNANGTLTIGAVTGGTAPYTYSVDGSAFTATLVYNNLAAGNHTVSVTDANGCIFNAPPATINNTGGATAVVVTTTAATCGNANGTLTIGAVTGGTAPYTFSVDGSAFTGTLVYNNLAAGNHTVAVKDANGCIFNAAPATINNTGGATAVVVTTTAATCGNANGTLTIGAVTGGTAPYTYSVDGSAFTATLVYTNLAAGNHTVSVTDANGCVFNAPPATINNTGGATAVVVTTTAATCGNANGTLTIGAVTGGTAPYTYSVDGSAFTGTLVYNNLAAGNHTVSVNGCQRMRL